MTFGLVTHCVTFGGAVLDTHTQGSVVSAVDYNEITLTQVMALPLAPFRVMVLTTAATLNCSTPRPRESVRHVSGQFSTPESSWM